MILQGILLEDFSLVWTSEDICSTDETAGNEVLYPLSYMEFGMKSRLEIDAEGYAHPPKPPGTGVELDWDTDVSWKGGVTPVMKTAHLAESFGVQCELHTTIYHPLEAVNLHCCCAISNCEFFEVLCPLSYMEFGMKSRLEIDAEGYAHPPKPPGTGVELDWDFIDNCTIKKL